MTDTLSDFLIRLKNASMANNHQVVCPHSNYKHKLATFLVDQGYLQSCDTGTSGKFKSLVVTLINNGIKTSLLDIRLISKPGRRVYSPVGKLSQYAVGIGLVIISTPSGLMTVKQAQKANLGGEAICRIILK